MRKYTLIKYFKGDASEKEVDSIIEWVNSSQENKKYFANEKAIFTALQMNANQLNINSKSGKKTKFAKIALAVSAAAAAAALFFIFGNLYGRLNVTSNSADVIGLSKNQYAESLYTEKGVKGFIILPDSTKVWLNSDSKISYPPRFYGKYRNIRLCGEAYFEVTKDPAHPMLIETNKNVSVEVLGTTFNLKCYDNEDNAEATLFTGKIKMNYRDSKRGKIRSINLEPSQSATYSDKDAETGDSPKVFSYQKPIDQMAWKNGNLIFDNAPMSEVFKVLERWHGTKFIVKDKGIYKHTLSAEFSSESIIQIMEIMKMIMPLEYSFNNNTVTIYSEK